MNDSQTKICLIGGTFDPIHLGHTFIATQAVRELGLDKVIFLPCKQSPHKTHTKSAENQHRLAMCQLATKALPWAEVSDYDLVAPSPSYSWRTVEHFTQLYPNAKIYWLMGTDQWDALARWNRADYFASLVNIIVYSREEPPQPQPSFECIPLTGIQHPASATQIRKAQDSVHAQSWLHPVVAQYVKENDLYLKSPLD